MPLYDPPEMDEPPRGVPPAAPIRKCHEFVTTRSCLTPGRVPSSPEPPLNHADPDHRCLTPVGQRDMSALDEQLRVQLRAALRAPRYEAHERLADLDVGAELCALEYLGQCARLRFRIVRLQVQLRQAQPVALLEQVVDPVARRVQLEPVPRVRRDERPSAAVLLHAQLGLVRARESPLELLLVEREPEMVDARQRPLARLHDDVDGAELELREPELEPDLIELRPRHAGFVGREVNADPPVPRDQVEAELADVPRLDLTHAARHQVVV